MSEWWTYRLSDFLMFSPAVYWRLVERYNRGVWPLQALTLAMGLVLLWWVTARRPMAGRAVAGLLAVLWLGVGWAFHWQRYATINWAANYFAVGFALQALLLLMAAVKPVPGNPAAGNAQSRAVGLALATSGVMLYPLLGAAAGRDGAQAEVFGLMPEPTALATVGLLMATRQPYRGWLMVIPITSLLIGVATWWLLR